MWPRSVAANGDLKLKGTCKCGSFVEEGIGRLAKLRVGRGRRVGEGNACAAAGAGPGSELIARSTAELGHRDSEKEKIRRKKKKHIVPHEIKIFQFDDSSQSRHGVMKWSNRGIHQPNNKGIHQSSYVIPAPCFNEYGSNQFSHRFSRAGIMVPRLGQLAFNVCAVCAAHDMHGCILCCGDVSTTSFETAFTAVRMSQPCLEPCISEKQHLGR